MKHQVEEKPGATRAAEECHHFWKIEVANGPTSVGECRYCGERREFHNAFPTMNPLRRGHVAAAVPAGGGRDDEDEEGFA